MKEKNIASIVIKLYSMLHLKNTVDWEYLLHPDFILFVRVKF